jgi:hypothetical protein
LQDGRINNGLSDLSHQHLVQSKYYRWIPKGTGAKDSEGESDGKNALLLKHTITPLTNATKS